MRYMQKVKGVCLLLEWNRGFDFVSLYRDGVFLIY